MLNRLYSVLDDIYKTSDIPLRRLSKKVLDLSDYFNSPSPTGWNYAKDLEFRYAYLFYFYPLNVYKYITILKFFNQHLHNTKSFLDIGAGPLTFYTALSLFDVKVERLYAVDLNNGFMQSGRQIIERLTPEFKNRIYFGYPKEEVDFINFGNVICELPEQERINFLTKNLEFVDKKKSFINILEPGTRRAFKGILTIRDYLIEKGYFLLNPCPSLSCPRQNDWCHENIYFPRSELIQIIENQTGLNNRFINFCYLFLSAKESESHYKKHMKVISNLMEYKGFYAVEVCTEKGLKRFEIMKRHITDGNEKFTKISRGDIIQIEGYNLAGKIYRLTKDSRVRIVKKFSGESL